LEVVLGSYAMGALVPCFVAAVVGATVFNWLHGSALALPTPAFAFVHPFGVAFMFPLGVLAGGLALAYTRGLNLVESVHERLRWGFAAKAAVGGLAVGLVGLALPPVLGVGYAAMEAAATGRLAAGTLGLLLVGKFLATMLTIGAGGSGGVFAPSLFLGVTLGGAFGALLHAWLPASTAPGPLYAVAGMGAVFAAAAQAPLTAVTIILEMTGDYRLVTGVMIACAISYLFYGLLAPDSMYTVRLTRRGIQILRGSEVRPLGRVAVAAAMDRHPLQVRSGASVDDAYRLLAARQAEAALVVDDAGGLVGVLEVAQALAATEPAERARTVGEVVRRDVPVLTPEASLDDAMARFALHGVRLIPVVAAASDNRPVGALTRDAVLQAYYRHSVVTLEMRHRLDLLPKRRAREGHFREVVLPDGWGGGQSVYVADLGAALPRGVVLVAANRGDEQLVVRGDTELRAGDRVLLYAAGEEELAALERLVAGGAWPRGATGLFRRTVVGDGGATGVPLRDLSLPPGVLVVSIRRGGTTLVPDGATRLAAGDAVLLHGADPASLAAAERLLAGHGAGRATGAVVRPPRDRT
jgi:CIC family chloride channel protein